MNVTRNVKGSRALLMAGTLGLLTAGTIRHLHASSAAIPTLAAAAAPDQGGSFPESWINGVDCAGEPAFQVHAYNEDLYILRQSKCVNFEAPFLYLIFGDDKALLIDTGASNTAPVYDTVRGVIEAWLKKNGRTEIPLVVAHSHSHGDHFMGDGQFAGQPGVETVVGLGQDDVESFWGFEDYPRDLVTYDLGGRVLDVIGTPGHQPASITLYDRRTQLLLTGDLIYPGHIFIFSPNHWRDFVASLRRLAVFAREHPVQWLVGCHIEYSDEPGEPFMYSTPAHPDEHVLQLDPGLLRTMLRAAWSMEDNPECRVYDEFVIHIVYECGILWNG